MQRYDDGSEADEVPEEYRTCVRCRHWDHTMIIGPPIMGAACCHPEAPTGPHRTRITRYDHGCEKWAHRPGAPHWLPEGGDMTAETPGRGPFWA